ASEFAGPPISAVIIVQGSGLFSPSPVSPAPLELGNHFAANIWYSMLSPPLSDTILPTAWTALIQPYFSDLVSKVGAVMKWQSPVFNTSPAFNLSDCSLLHWITPLYVI